MAQSLINKDLVNGQDLLQQQSSGGKFRKHAGWDVDLPAYRRQVD
jgi:hypothetical protein